MSLIDKDKITIFDILNSLTGLKEDISSREDFEKIYNPFMINRFFSMDAETLFIANFVSQMSHLPKKVQYDFYFRAIDKKKKFFKYEKKEQNNINGLDEVSEYYQINKSDAYYLMINILSKEQISNIMKVYESNVMKGNK